MASLPLWAAIRTIKSKIGTWEGFDKYRELDPNLTRERWATAIGEARAALSNRVDEITRPLNQRPVGSEITPFRVSNPGGFIQHVEVFVRDRDTGIIDSRYYMIKTDTLRSRQAIVRESLNRYSDAAANAPDDYPEEIVGAVYTGTHERIAKV